MSSSDIFFGEVIGTAVLILLGGGVCAAVTFKRSKAYNAGWVAITFGWGIAVLTGAYMSAGVSGAHLNPAVTLGLAIEGGTEWSDVPLYFAVRMAGAMLGAALVWLGLLRPVPGPPHRPRDRRRPRRATGPAEDATAGPVLGVFFTSPRSATRAEPRHRDHRHLRAGHRDPHAGPQRDGIGPPAPRRADRGAGRASASASRSVAPRGTPSTRSVTSARASSTRCCPLPNKGGSDWTLRLGPGRRPAGRRRRSPQASTPRVRLSRRPEPPDPTPIRTDPHGRADPPQRRHRSDPHEPHAHSTRPVHRRHRPGHHLQPLHRLRQGRPHRRGRPEGARADLPEARLGRARRRRDLDQRPGGRRGRPGEGRASPRPTSRRSASPTSARRRCCGTGRPASRCTTPSSGRTPAPTRSASELGRNVGQDRFRRETGLPLASYFAGPEDPLAARQRRRAAGARRARRTALRHHGLLGHLEPHRRRRTAACTSPTSPTPPAPC